MWNVAFSHALQKQAALRLQQGVEFKRNTQPASPSFGGRGTSKGNYLDPWPDPISNSSHLMTPNHLIALMASSVKNAVFGMWRTELQQKLAQTNATSQSWLA